MWFLYIIFHAMCTEKRKTATAVNDQMSKCFTNVVMNDLFVQVLLNYFMHSNFQSSPLILIMTNH